MRAFALDTAKICVAATLVSVRGVNQGFFSVCSAYFLRYEHCFMHKKFV